jgi:hypothetical protein
MFAPAQIGDGMISGAAWIFDRPGPVVVGAAARGA